MTTQRVHDLYDPLDEHDACGIGLLVNISGQASHELLRQGLSAASKVSHRGGCSADGVTGDGGGVQTQLPRKLFQRALTDQGVTLDDLDDLAVAMIFLPHDEDKRQRAEAIAEDEARRGGLKVLGWRTPPTAPDVLGRQARETVPVFRQLLVARPEATDEWSHAAFGRKLYVIRRLMQKRTQDAGCDPFHVCSFSHQTIVYKGLLDTADLPRFFLDLADPDYETAILVFHRRFSTNTFPTWHLAQPFRFLAHNGEINTIRGNVNWMKARQSVLQSPVFGDDLPKLYPIVNSADSDSATLDRVLEFLVMSGVHPWHALAMLIPEAHQKSPHMTPKTRAMFEYYATRMEPWDGPAAVVLSDGVKAMATLDRNGLRPLRYCVTHDGLLFAGSEAGLIDLAPDQILENGRLGPGEMIAVDTATSQWWRNAQLKAEMGEMLPFASLLQAQLCVASDEAIPPVLDELPRDHDSEEDLVRQQKIFGYGKEDISRIIKPMWTKGRVPMGSMGDDTPLACMSEKPQLLYRYFKQRFAQVTNPPIDPIREAFVMSLNTCIGRRGNMCDVLYREELPPTVDEGALVDDAALPKGDALALVATSRPARLMRFSSPILSAEQLQWLTDTGMDGFAAATLQARFPVDDGPEGLAPALDDLCQRAAQAVHDGATLLIISDRQVDEDHAPIPMLLATAAIHHHLIREGVRLQSSLICDTGEAREDHHMACLLGFGASLIHPHLAMETIATYAPKDERDEALERYKKALEKGLYKTLSRMGIATLASYRGAQMFEALGLSKTLLDQHFQGTTWRVDGVGLDRIATDALRFHAEAYGERPRLVERGIYRYRRGGEYHAFNPAVFKLLHKAVRKEDPQIYAEFAEAVEQQPACHLRDLLAWRPLGPALPVEEVESAASIATRFCTQAMSHGALSREAHEVLSVAMNRLGARSNSGEGGEASERFKPYTAETAPAFPGVWSPAVGDLGNSTIKQIATGRFGVTPSYLLSASEIEIKMAQGAKPGEGGQIPGFKVTAEIAGLRRAAPGLPLISPPPHHDIYSIEDLEQLIYDLKRLHPAARIVVKLVSQAGVGTIAAGVAKAHADCIQISGHDGGTGASPLSSIKHAGMPWEIGLAEAQQVLVRNGLRGRLRLRVDGGFKTGRDVIFGALLGAEEFGFGTAALIASGCVMARQCHANTCPVGIATQRPELRARFPGTPEHIISFVMYIAEQVRQLLAQMGASQLEQLIGRVDLLEQRDALLPELDLSPLLAMPADSAQPLRHTQPRNDRPEPTTPLDQQVYLDGAAALDRGQPWQARYAIDNQQRSVGARLAGEIARRHGEEGLPDETLSLHFAGTAGQSFGAFCTHGMAIYLDGEAQDYVGKSMHGGLLVLRPAEGRPQDTHNHTIMGNTNMYGATGGHLFAAGRAGERLCVRNSGGVAVVEGCGDHACEYMTDGVAVILGTTGHNVGAGMSGGVAYIYDPDDALPARVNRAMVTIDRQLTAAEMAQLKGLLAQHHQLTNSPRAAMLLDDWAQHSQDFWVVRPHITPATEAEDDATRARA